jgi:hypothetical protein
MLLIEEHPDMAKNNEKQKKEPKIPLPRFCKKNRV